MYRSEETWVSRKRDAIFDPCVEALPSLGGKCVAITGCTTGTGFYTAVAAARKGAACILLLNRSSERAVESERAIKAMCGAETTVHTVDCDLRSLAAVRKAASETERICAGFGGLDVLCNNAGIMMFPDERTADGLEVQMQVNHTSHFYLTKLLMPALEAAAASRGEARVVQHSSGARNMFFADLEERYFARSEPGTLGGDRLHDKAMRYHMVPQYAMS